MKDTEEVKSQVLQALKHDEAEDGLFFRNFFHLHEVDEREPVRASETQLLEALKELVTEGKVKIDDSGDELVFKLASCQ